MPDTTPTASDLRAFQGSQPAPVPEYVRTKPHFYHDPECGLLWFATEAEALAYAAESLKCFSKDARHDGEWPDEVEDMRVGIVTHATAEIGNDDDGYDYKMVPLPAAVPSPEGADRDAFEAAYRDAYKVTCEVCHDKFERSASDDYEDVTVMVGWRMWRAALAAQPKDLQKTPNLVQNSSLTPAAQAPAEGDGDAWPIAKLKVDGDAVTATLYAPGLPDGEFDVWLEPATAAAAPADDMLEPLIYAAIMHNGTPKTVADFERAAAGVADMLKRRAQPQPKGTVADVPMCSEQAVLHAVSMAQSEAHKQGDVAFWQAFGRAMWRQFNAMLPSAQSPAPAHAAFPAPDLRGIDGATLGEWRMLGLPAKAVLIQEKDLPTIIERACRAYGASPAVKPVGYVTAIEEGKVLMLPRQSLNTAGLVPVYAGPAQAPAVGADDARDATRWRTFIGLDYAIRAEWAANLSLAPVLTQWVDNAAGEQQ